MDERETPTMRLSKNSLKKLREVINGENGKDYRTGPELVNFFNELGFCDEYQQGFPSRWRYTDEKLDTINGTPMLGECIKKTFAVVNFADRIEYLDGMISNFNKFLVLDKWKVLRENDKIIITPIDRIIIVPENTKNSNSAVLDEESLKSVDGLGLSKDVAEIVKMRLDEIVKCINCDAPLAAIILMGGTLEGILFDMASSKYPSKFNQASCAPKFTDNSDLKMDGKVKKFPNWTLNNFINVAGEIGMINQGMTDFSHVLRNYRNCIHPSRQEKIHFKADRQTALVCNQVLNGVIRQICEYTRDNPSEVGAK